MHIEGGKRLAARHNGSHALDPSQQHLELRLHLQHDPGPGPREQGDVARKLDRIAQSLLGVQQDRASLQRVLSKPERTAVAAALRRHSGSPPTPFVLLKTAAKFADAQ